MPPAPRLHPPPTRRAGPPPRSTVEALSRAALYGSAALAVTTVGTAFVAIGMRARVGGLGVVAVAAPVPLTGLAWAVGLARVRPVLPPPSLMPGPRPTAGARVGSPVPWAGQRATIPGHRAPLRVPGRPRRPGRPVQSKQPLQSRQPGSGQPGAGGGRSGRDTRGGTDWAARVTTATRG